MEEKQLEGEVFQKGDARPIDKVNLPHVKAVSPGAGMLASKDALPLKRAKRGKGKRNPSALVHQWESRARLLIRMGAGRWAAEELAESIALRDAVVAWLASKPRYWRLRTEGFLRELDAMRVQALARRAQSRRASGTQVDYPDRTRITEYAAAGGRITWATSRRK